MTKILFIILQFGELESGSTDCINQFNGSRF